MEKDKSMLMGVKLSPAHFPVGTVFKADPGTGSWEKKDQELVAIGVRCNGPRSWLVHYNDDPKRTVTGLPYDSIHISHVTEIIKRGDGESIKHICFESLPKYVPTTHLGNTGTRQFNSRTHYDDFYQHWLVSHLLSKHGVSDDEWVDTDRLIAAMSKLTFGNNLGLGFMSCRFYPKKRLDKWFKQNIRRFLKPMKLIIAEEAQLWENIMLEDMMSEYDF